MARRAYPRDVRVDVSRQPWTVSAAHDGYRRLPGASSIDGNGSSAPNRSLVDRLEGKHKAAQARFHFHPRIEVALSRLHERAAETAPMASARFDIERTGLVGGFDLSPRVRCSIRNRCLVVELEHAESIVAFTF